MESLVDFLNHGILPFIGRDNERDAIHNFWRNTLDVQELRTLLLIGEAGIGKSRLLEEVLPEIEAAGGTVLRAKLYPESAPIIPVIAEALWYNEAVRRLLKSEPEATPGAVAERLRRLSRLRPTLLIVEDIHLLEGAAVREFADVLNAVAEETIALVCSARPTELAARPLLERFMAEEITLSGWEGAEVATLWDRLFGVTAQPELVALLRDASGGNPLALRSSIRNAIKSGALRQDAVSQRWQPSEGLDAFGRSLRRSIDLLAEGMAANLSNEERAAAEQLAALGEVFARETAEAIVPDAGRLIGLLVFRGVLAQSATATPALPGRASEQTLLAFTHTLLHQYLIGAAGPLPSRVAEAIADGLPLYSIAPLLRLRHAAAFDDTPTHTVELLIDRMLEIARHLDLGPTWAEAMQVWTAASELFEWSLARWDDHDIRRLRARVLNRKLSLQRRFAHTDDYRTLAQYVVDLSGGSNDEAMLVEHLQGLRYLYVHTATREYSSSRAIWERAELLVEAHPWLRFTRPYVNIVGDAAATAARVPDMEMMRRTEACLKELLASDRLPEELRRRARYEIAPRFLQIFENADQLSERFSFLHELLADGRDAASQLLTHRITLLESTGHYLDVLDAAEQGMDLFRHQGFERDLFQCSLTRLCARAALGSDLEEIADTAWRLCSSASQEAQRQRFRRNCSIYLSEVGLLRGDEQWTRRVMERFAPGEPFFGVAGELLLALAAGDPNETVAALEGEEETERLLAAFARSALAAPRAPETERLAAELLERSILRTNDLLTLHATISIAMAAKADGATLDTAIATAIGHALDWLADRQLGAYMAPIVERYERYLSRRDSQYWRGRLREIGLRNPVVAPERPEENESRVSISMLGTITVQEPGGELRKLRGGRLQTVLGLLVAARMFGKPITNNEFCRIAAGGEQDIDLARKTANMAIVRLRETFGAELIVTGPETYELNLERVRVNLLDADAQLREAAAAMRRRALMLAYPAAMQALSMTRGEVPFPGLYDDFFEALREDFENRLRHTVVDVARALLLEADAGSAAELLREAVDGMPDDEEMVELLCEALIALGRRAEAERIKMRSDDEMEA